jgi:Subtilase family
MPASYHQDVILAAPSARRPGEIDRLNAILQNAGLGRPLGPPEQGTSELAVLPVSGADPQDVADALRKAAPEHGEDLLSATPDFVYNVDTVPHRPHGQDLVPSDPGLLIASGKKSGHGTVTWTPVPFEEMPPAPPWPPDGPGPVVAVLDSGVQPHPWLPAPADGAGPFLVEPPQCPPVQVEQPGPDHFGGYLGHATFLTGLIRLMAPNARVLSLRIMKDDGTVRERDVIETLACLARYKEHGHVLDVVLMAFGRPRVPADDGPGKLKKNIARLGELGVTFVASAGNDGSAEPTIPASLAADPGSAVVSVGAGASEGVHALYSNHGPWVRKWRCGTDVISIMPMRLGRAPDGYGYAQWSGTSFSAAIYAGELAQARAGERTAEIRP